MNICKSKLAINGVIDIEENILPKLREASFNKELIDGGLLESEHVGFAYMTGDRCLPYRMQDGYTRDKKLVEMDTVELENDVVKVIVLPKQGGRVWSMFNKVEEREILFCNPVFQPGNLAVRNAWVSGGIEWNMGQYGHSTLTMDHVYAALCEAEDGREFLRLYEYERIKGMFLQVDLHLLPGDTNLYAHVEVINNHREERSLYWWTNIAVELNRDCRVISGTEDVIATTPVDGINTFAHAKLPYLPSMPDADGTFPEKFMFSSEYFFQNKKDMKQTWEVAAYNDNTAFFERSTAELPYKKMFCWSNEQGGYHWQHFLATDDAPLYVELQAGVIPTQVHGDTLAGQSKIAFTQAFGDLHTDVKSTHESEYVDCMKYCYDLLEDKLSEETLKAHDVMFTACSELPVKEVLFCGSGYALLEEERLGDFIPASMKFTLDAHGDAADWKSLLTEAKTPELVDGYAKSYMTDEAWLPYLKVAAEKSTENGNVDSKFYYGVALFENGFFEEALVELKAYAEVAKSAIAYRTIGNAYSRLQDTALAMEWYDKAFALVADLDTGLDADYYEEYLKYLVELKEFRKAWDLYSNAPEEIKATGNVQLRAIGAAIECGDMEFAKKMFDIEQVNIREGEAVLNEYWVRMRELEFIAEGIEPTEAKVKAEALTLPYIVDFRLN